jgi:hypothetical protein
MLSVNLPVLKQNLNALIEIPPVSESVMYKAAYNAYYNVNKSSLDFNVDVIDTDLLPDVLKQQQKCEEQLKINAKIFAEELCKELKNGKFMDTIAEQITNHIKTAQIDITIPTLPPTITSPMGPCSGSLIISNTAGAKIVIS